MKKIPQLLVGTFQNEGYKSLLNIVRSGIEAGFTGFDTAPSYGTELHLGKAVKECCTTYNLRREDFFISDKIDVWQMQTNENAIRESVKLSIKKMGLGYLDMLFIHWPIAEYVLHTWRCMQELQKDGIVKHIGICNIRERHLQAWSEQDIIPKFVQIERHPMRTCQKEIEYCKDHNIKVISYSPLCRMHPNLRNSAILQAIAAKYKKNIGQVILRWQIDTEAIPVFMSKKPLRIKENAEIFNFYLTSEEIEQINSLDQNYKIFLESWGCPGF